MADYLWLIDSNDRAGFSPLELSWLFKFIGQFLCGLIDNTNQKRFTMDAIIAFLPNIASGIVMLIGLICFFKPQIIMDSCGINMTNNMALSEVRGVFGGLNIGSAAAAFIYADPMVYTTIGMAWSVVALARFYSMAVDGSTIKESIAPIILDGSIALMYLSATPLLWVVNFYRVQAIKKPAVIKCDCRLFHTVIFKR